MLRREFLKFLAVLPLMRGVVNVDQENRLTAEQVQEIVRLTLPSYSRRSWVDITNEQYQEQINGH